MKTDIKREETIGGSQPGTQLSLVSEAAIAVLSETLRIVFAVDQKSIVTRLSSLPSHDRGDKRESKGRDMPPALA